MAVQPQSQATNAVKVRVRPTVPHGSPLQIDGECLRLQGLVAAYHRNLRQMKTDHQRLVLKTPSGPPSPRWGDGQGQALRRAQAQLRLARQNSRRWEAA